jgi:uncharacterized protein YdiU (UPF0061 family)
MGDTNKTTWNWDTTYLNVNEYLFTEVKPTPVSSPKLLLFNENLAKDLGLTDLSQEDCINQLSGNVIPTGAKPLAQAYAGHQFGHFNVLGDGRAILCGEHITPIGNRFDIQLKGSGRTPYSRNGDGRATISAMLREYLISEAMHGLGIATTRSLAVVSTGEDVYRENAVEGAVLTRVAQSHIRVGTFQFAAKYLPKEELREFCLYVIERHYPKLLTVENPPLAFLKKVQEKQIALIVEWMRVGFIHGVMNTDNMSIPGETIDYGPCAFMNNYNPRTVFSSIDRNGRYAFGNQPSIAQWNIACLASALIPIIHDEKEKAIELCQEVINDFPIHYEKSWAKMMCCKLGILEEQEEDAALIKELLTWMETNQADYTNTFLQLDQATPEDGIYSDSTFIEWHNSWKKRVSVYDWNEVLALMEKSNPKFIPRNHLVEEALSKAALSNDFSLFSSLLNVLQKPYQENQSFQHFQNPPDNGDLGYKTFCGT